MTKAVARDADDAAMAIDIIRLEHIVRGRWVHSRSTCSSQLAYDKHAMMQIVKQASSSAPVSHRQSASQHVILRTYGSYVGTCECTVPTLQLVVDLPGRLDLAS